MNIISVKNLSKDFGQERVLKSVTHDFERGKIHGIVGNNGSGKTVLMKCICGFLIPTEGEVIVNGKRVGKDVDFPPGLGLIIETPGFLPNMTGVKNLEILASLIMEDPALLILDEPLNGLDKHGVREMRQLIKGLKEQGKTILLASHNQGDIDELCDTVCEMDAGVMTMIREESI